MTKPKQITAGESGAALTPTELQRIEMEGFMNLIREASNNPNVDPKKLDKLLSLRERVMDRGAEQQFHDAMHRAQARMGFIATDKQNRDKGNRYASFKALDREIRPIYASEGFSVSYDTGPGPLNDDKTPKYGPIPEGYIRILMDIAHSAGHKIQKHTDIPIETTGAQGTKMMTKIHATGSAMSYGKRYLLIFGFNLAVGEEDDDDGNKAGKRADAQSGGKGGKGGGIPQSKSRGKDTVSTEADEGMKEKYPGVVRTNREGDRIQPSSLGTMRANLKRFKIPEERFEADFGFPLEETHKGGLNDMIDWMKEVANA